MKVARHVRVLVCACALACAPASLWAATPHHALATPKKSRRAAPALSPWNHALAARESLEALRAPHLADFTLVLDEFRAIYHLNPRDPHAAEAVSNVAELLAEQGRSLDDAKSLKAAVSQYEFLRAQYPASSFARTATAKEKALRLELTPLSVPARVASVREVQARPPDASPNRDEAARMATQRVALPATVNARRSGPLAQITGIRHWSTATYTRVAIDLGDQVTFEAARVAHPDRIYFDLHGARLSSELAGKTFDVTDDGFLRKIRAAQFSGDMTRVVLDVSDVSDYTAFLLPNPYRLIIDIHGAKAGSPAVDARSVPAETAESSVPVPLNADRKASAAANLSGLPPTAPTDGGDLVRPAAQAGSTAQPATPARVGTAHAPRVATLPVAKGVPNTVATKAPDTTLEVAAVSTQPDREEATAAPSSKPIVVRRGDGSAPGGDVKSLDGSEAPAHRDRAARNGLRNGARDSSGKARDAASPAKAAAKTADGETSMIRALGLGIGRIVIDAGHGGHDSGTLGVDGIEEKDVVLDVALRLGKLLQEKLGAEIIYTRSDDTFIPLETRTAIANKAQADLFLSIHANSSQDESARGVETYYLNFTSSADALDVAARENAVSGQSIHQLSDLVKKIALKDKIAESREFAADIESSLFAGLQKGNAGLKDRGVKKAPFVVLIGANMPSILAEISFVTNGRDAAQLRTPEYRQRVAESLYSGVAKYESSLAGPKAPAGLRAAAQ